MLRKIDLLFAAVAVCVIAASANLAPLPEIADVAADAVDAQRDAQQREREMREEAILREALQASRAASGAQ